MKYSIAVFSACRSLAILTALAAPASSQGVPFEEGANGLFVGHSFFVPVAALFNQIAVDSGFVDHEFATVFGPGPAGSPGELWDNPTTQGQIDAMLATGSVEIFGMTSFSPMNSAYEDFAQWIDLALSYNSDTVIFIGQPWAPAGPNLPTATFDQTTEEMGEATFAIVSELRTAYPSAKIEFLNYGKTGPLMKAEFEAGTLPDIEVLVGLGDNALFADGAIGHAGLMMTELCALSWLNHLYGAELSELTYTDWDSDVQSIVDEVMNFNVQYLQGPSCGCVARRGDVNNDNALNLVDAIALLDFLFSQGIEPASCLEVGDLNADGAINLTDPIHLLSYLFSNGAPPVAPGYPNAECLSQ